MKPGDVVMHRFEIESLAGAGGMALVYRARDRATGGHVAIKVVAGDAEVQARLSREASVLADLDHPGIVRYVGHGTTDDGELFMAIQWLSGIDLHDRLEKGPITAIESVTMARRVAEALGAAHARGVVHRDVKPANLFLPDGEVDRVKLLDFGIARVEWEETRITNMGAPLGTPGYMSPEQESGGEVDARSDVYAIGAVLYECLVGEPPPATPSDMWTAGKRPPSSIGLRLPLDAEDDARVRAARPDSGVHPASRRLPSAAPAAMDTPIDVPAGWRVIIERALAKKPEDRFQDARSLLGAIRSLRSESSAISGGAPPAVSST